MSALFIEMRKAFINRWFLIAIIAGTVTALASAMGSIMLYGTSLDYIQEWWGLVDPALSNVSCFRFFMTSDYIQAATDFFYALLPLFAMVPYSWSLCKERGKNYVQGAFLQCGRSHYMAAKALAAAASGGIVVAVSLSLNCLACACFIPAYTPSVVTVFNTGVYETVMGSELFYNAPALFVVFYVVLSILFSSCWAALVQLLGWFAKSSVRLISGMFLLLYLFTGLEHKIAVLAIGDANNYISASPLIWLRGVAVSGGTDFAVAASWLVGLLLLSCLLVLSSRKDDVL